MKPDLTDITFLMSTRIDSIIRLENILLTLDYLHQNFTCRIIVLEASRYNNKLLQNELNIGIEYLFIEDKDDILHRSRYHNQLANMVTTPFLAIWDADVIVPKQQIEQAMNMLRSEEFDLVYPYNGEVLDTSEIIREHYLLSRDICILRNNKAKMRQMYGAKSAGGAIMISTQKYRYAGMENEQIYGWGQEDFELHERCKRLNFRIGRSEDVLFHLTHPRGANSSFYNNVHGANSNMQLFTTSCSSAKELLNDERFKLIQ